MNNITFQGAAAVVMDKSVVKTLLLSVRHYLSDRVYYYKKVKNYAKYVDIFLAVKPVPAKATPKLGRPCNKLPVLT
jgi:hypothetical protein